MNRTRTRRPAFAVLLLTVAPVLAANSREAGPVAGAAPDVAGGPPTVFLQGLLAATNAARAENGLPALSWSADLAAVARAHADDMLSRGYFAHVTPEGAGPAERLAKNAPRAIVLGLRENLAKSEGEENDTDEERAREIVEGWMKSPGHRENLLSADSVDVGFGVAARTRNGRLYEYAVQLLGVVAGHWEGVPPASLRAPARWEARLVFPVEFFVDDLTHPERSYSDPANSSMLWKGGKPLVVSTTSGITRVEIPGLDPGSYKILVRKLGESGYQETRSVKILRSPPSRR